MALLKMRKVVLHPFHNIRFSSIARIRILDANESIYIYNNV
jgi:hypothetical protein